MRVVSVVVGLALAGCTGSGSAHPAGPPAALANAATSYGAAGAGGMLPAGVLVGKVEAFDGQTFQPAGGVPVTVEGLGLTSTTDADGSFGFQQVPAGEVHLTARRDGHEPATLVCRLTGVAGLPRANLALVPSTRPAGLAKDAVALVGIVTDPRGAALPGGTVHLVDSVSAGGAGSNQKLQANGDGFFASVLAGIPLLAGGQAELTAFGYTPGGVPVETTSLTTVGLGASPVVGLVLGATAFGTVDAPAWTTGSGRGRAIAAGKMPLRRDELVFHLTQDGRTADVAPDYVADGRAGLTLPEGFALGSGTVEIRTLGLVPAPSVPIGF
ncbi:MAG: hypothetical protein JWM80_6303 [Cyanobacteria bacterium RYN_339]|nr:hypothetical protein [Cyanobacteria bacterium RYN_339]